MVDSESTIHVVSDVASELRSGASEVDEKVRGWADIVRGARRLQKP